MDIFLSINNREQVIQLPIIPKEFQVDSPQSNETFKTISQGDIKLIGLRGLKSITIESFFPNKEYSFARDKTYKAWDYVEMIESWIDKRVPIRLLITDTPINMPVTIESFQYGVKDGSGDVYYSLSLSEFKFVQLETKQV